MPARRRRVGSEHDSYDPMITTSNNVQQLNSGGDSIRRYYDNDRVTRLENDNKQQEPNNLVTMTSRDRTKEFANAIRTMQGRTVARAAVMRDPRQARQIQSYSNFMMIARNIGKNIASTYTKLEKLALREYKFVQASTKLSLRILPSFPAVAKKKSLFDDRPSEIQELTYIIKGDLGSLNQQIAKLQEVGRQQRESLGSTRGHHLASHSSSIVVALQSKLASMSNQFKNVLEVRTEVSERVRRSRNSRSTESRNPSFRI